MPKQKEGAMGMLAKDIKRQIGTVANKAFLRRMPMFAIDRNTPDDITSLLGELEAVENRQRRHSQS